MARRLTEPMKKVLGIMAEGHEIKSLRDMSGGLFWLYVPPPEDWSRPRGNTVVALQKRGLLESIEREENWRLARVVARYALTDLGRRAEEELA